MFKSNIGIMNALVRITAGLSFLSYGTARLIKRPWQQSSLLIIFLSAMKVAEGIVRYCPVTAVVKSPKVSNMLHDILPNQEDDKRLYQQLDDEEPPKM
ncbi:YgaP family membrane protein [Salirhabdus sp. Marseille-P4669]|uniref:YgaP family membrane protein n=1 Tax=Salirhabdus sp. Marseille-P4669 TaxID=2042310 RepID=UPI001F4067AC|nr:DUF2892 domain-containing protein [Salirhabdus sp. Marseille-P4669]